MTCIVTRLNQNTTKGSFRHTWVYAFQQIAKRVNYVFKRLQARQPEFCYLLNVINDEENVM